MYRQPLCETERNTCNRRLFVPKKTTKTHAAVHEGLFGFIAEFVRMLAIITRCLDRLPFTTGVAKFAMVIVIFLGFEGSHVAQ